MTHERAQPAAARAARAWRGLYAIVDPELCAGRDPLALAQAILAGGCGVLQLRAKRGSTGGLEALATAMHGCCRQAGVPFVINDHVELALRIGAQGVHLGQNDAPVESARARLGPNVVIGLSTHDLAQARDAVTRGADLIGFGPVFATSSKPNADPVVGLEQLRAVCAAVPLPVVAIGGITPERAPAVAAAGAPLAAAISALCSAADPRASARRIHTSMLLRAG